MSRKVIMLLDSKGEKGGFLYSHGIFSVSDAYAKKLVELDKAVYHDAQKDAKRIVNLDGKEMIWGDYLKLKIKQRKQ